MNSHLEQIYRRLDELEEQLKKPEERPLHDNLVNVELHSDVFRVPTQTDTGQLREERRKQAAVHIAKTMERVYSLGDLRELCFEFGLEYESFGGETRRDKIRQIVFHFYKFRTLKVFVEWLEGDRPNEVWRIKTGE